MPVLRPGMLPGSPQYQGLCRWCSEVLPGTGRLRWYGHVLRKDDDDWIKNVSLWRLMDPHNEISWENISLWFMMETKWNCYTVILSWKWTDLDKDMNDLHSNWVLLWIITMKKMIRGNWSDSNIDSNAVNWIRTGLHVNSMQTCVSIAFMTRCRRWKASSIDSPPTRTPRFFTNTTWNTCIISHVS